MRNRLALLALLACASPLVAQPVIRIPPVRTVATLGSAASVKLVAVTDGASASDCTVGGGSTVVLCIANGSAWVAVGGAGGGNSFETINAPTGTDPVADGPADTLNITCAGGLTCTGTAGTDTLDFTMGNVTDAQVPNTLTVDLATLATTATTANGVAANSVALGTDTTGGYAASATEGGAATSVAANSVALGTDTTGGYAASVSEGGPATTATAFAANGANCSAGSFPLGIDASGAVESCTAALANPLAAGSVVTNALQVVQTGTGLWQPATNTLGIAANGIEAARFNTLASGVNYVTVTPSVTGTGLAATRVEIAAAGSDANVSLSLLPKGASNATQSRVLFGANGGFTIWGDGDYQLGNNSGTGFSRLRFAGGFSLLSSSNALSVQDSSGASTWFLMTSNNDTRYDGNGGSRLCSISNENLTLSTSGATTDTSGSLAPANSRIESITYRISTTIATATAFTVKVKAGNSFASIGTATTSQTTLTAGTTGVLVPAAFADQFNATGTKLTVDTTGTPSAGALRLTVYACAFTAPTS